MLCKVEELQDLLIQQRQISDVTKMVEKDSTIRTLNIELAKKTEQIDDLKSRLRQLMGAKGSAEMANAGSNQEIVEHLNSIIKAREKELENQQNHINKVLRRENDLKEKLDKMEFLYELDPNKPLQKYKETPNAPSLTNAFDTLMNDLRRGDEPAAERTRVTVETAGLYF
jgi:uncharacterized coiled-coil protein SlyX